MSGGSPDMVVISGSGDGCHRDGPAVATPDAARAGGRDAAAGHRVGGVPPRRSKPVASVRVEFALCPSRESGVARSRSGHRARTRRSRRPGFTDTPIASAVGGPRTGPPAARAALTRGRGPWASTRWGCSRTGPDGARRPQRRRARDRARQGEIRVSFVLDDWRLGGGESASPSVGSSIGVPATKP